MKASRLLLENIEALLRARGQTQHDLAQWCRRSDSWLSKILKSQDAPERPGRRARERGLPLKYLDRIADFFGIATYQLLQPGISPLTERRKGQNRRTLPDRRLRAAQPGAVAAADLHLPAEAIARLLRIESLSRRDRDELDQLIAEAEKLRRTAAPSTALAPAAEDSVAAARHAIQSRRRGTRSSGSS